MSKQTITRYQATIVAVAPAVLFAAIAYHPYIPDLTDTGAVAAALVSDTARWGVAHLAVVVGFGLMALAFIAIRSYLREAGDERWSIIGLPFIVLGTTMFVLLPAIEIAMLGVAEVGADVEAVQSALDVWFRPILLSAALLSAIGVFGFVMGIVRTEVLGRGLTWLVVAALTVLALSRFAPLGGALYVGAVAGIVALWPIANDILNKHSSAPGEALRHATA
jgi:hypothetical protein